MSVLSSFRAEMAGARARLAGSDRRVLETALGRVEYLTFGEGSPVLWVHGVVGGADQARLWSRGVLGEGFRVVAVSRFGYLGSGLPSDSSPAAQADAYAVLLDELAIDRVALVASSAGTSSAFRFALRHPDRCRSLVVWSMAVPPYEVPPAPIRWALRRFFRSDLLFWATFALIWPIGRRLMGIPRAVDQHLTPDDVAFVAEAWRSFLPVSLRTDGIMNDICASNPDLNLAYPLEALAARVLVIHAQDDPWGSFAGAREIAARIPGARFEGISSGGHLMMGNHDAVRAMVAGFIRSES